MSMSSMSVLCACVCMVALVPLTSAYSTGPPVSISGVCTDMVPTGHGASAQTAASPYEIVTNQACYKDGQTVQVVVKTLSSSSSAIEGLFVQARNTSSTSTVGTFTVSDSVLSTLTCTTANSAVGHNSEVKTYYRSMTWTPPSGLTGDIKFRATIVEHKDTFWVGVESSAVSYNAGCAAGSALVNSRPYPDSGSSTLHAGPYCLALAFVSFLMAIYTQ